MKSEPKGEIKGKGRKIVEPISLRLNTAAEGHLRNVPNRTDRAVKSPPIQLRIQGAGPANLGVISGKPRKSK
jgi:hypothetical protein